ncbi:MAG: hypothetical protein Q9159_002555 [Coniocarpon cinnabarinum]
MARSSTTISFRATRERYVWPDAAINIWIIIMLATAGVLIGVFAAFINIQNHFRVSVPWIFPFGITVGGLTILFIVFLLVLISIRRLLPSVILVFSFLLFALYLTGLVETAIQLFSSSSNVNSNCQNYVLGSPVYGQTLNTLAWLEQQGICQSWFSKNWVVIRAGDPKKDFSVHRDILTARSPYFRAMFSKPFAEAKTGVVNLIRDESSVVHAYLHYVYHNTILFDPSGTDIEDNDWFPPIKLWLFGDKYQDVDYADRVMDAIIHRTRDMDENGASSFPIREATKLVYENTVSASCPLRRIIVAQHMKYGRPEWYDDEDWDITDSAFLLELAKAFFRKRMGTAPADPDNVHDTCAYHLHADGQCYKDKQS